MNTPEIGQTLYSRNTGSAARHSPSILTPVTVIKVGRKYFTCAPAGQESHEWRHSRFHLDTWRQETEYSPTECLYRSPQEWEDEKEASAINEKLRRHFQHGNSKLSLSALRQIASILQDAQGASNANGASAAATATQP